MYVRGLLRILTSRARVGLDREPREIFPHTTSTFPHSRKLVSRRIPASIRHTSSQRLYGGVAALLWLWHRKWPRRGQDMTTHSPHIVHKPCLDGGQDGGKGKPKLAGTVAATLALANSEALDTTAAAATSFQT